MLEIRITAPELSEAINNLAQALTSGTCAKKTPIGVAADAVLTSDTSVVAEGAHAPIGDPTTATPVHPLVTDTAPWEGPTNEVPAVSVPSLAEDGKAITSAPAPEAHYTLDMLANAGTSLIDAGKISKVTAILARHGVEALTSLDPSQYGSVANELRSLGAKI